MGQLVERDSRDPVMSNSCLFLLHGACYGLPFFLEGAEAEASLSSFHKIFQLPQTRWTQRLFTIHCLKIWARFPSCILRYLPTHATHTQRAARTDRLKKTSLNINPWQHIYTAAASIPIKWALSGVMDCLAPMPPSFSYTLWPVLRGFVKWRFW